MSSLFYALNIEDNHIKKINDYKKFNFYQKNQIKQKIRSKSNIPVKKVLKEKINLFWMIRN